MAIRRLLAADCPALSAFLVAQFAADPQSGGVGGPTSDFLVAQLEVAPTWIDYTAGKIRGVLGPAMFGRRMVGEVSRTFVYFNRLVVDYAIYTTNRRQALTIAKNLTQAAADELQAGTPPDDILIEGPTASRGASWSRLLKATEATVGGSSKFEFPFAEVWARLNAVVVT